MKKVVIVLLFVAAAGMIITGCKQEPSTQSEFTGALIVKALSDLPEAYPENSGQLYYVLEEEQFYYSDGSECGAIDLTGPQGPEGGAGLMIVDAAGTSVGKFVDY